MQIALGEGDFDLVLAQLFLEGEVKVAFEAERALDHLDRPDGELEIERAVAETHEQDLRRRLPAQWLCGFVPLQYVSA
jgi:hypothetical protein